MDASTGNTRQQIKHQKAPNKNTGKILENLWIGGKGPPTKKFPETSVDSPVGFPASIPCILFNQRSHSFPLQNQKISDQIKKDQ